MNQKTNTADRNALTLTLSVLTLAAVILGISFTSEKNSETALHSMDVIISNTRSAEAPDEADFLSQNNQQGGGTTEEKRRPQDLSSAMLDTENGISPVASTEQQKKQQDNQTPQLVTAVAAEQSQISTQQQEAEKQESEDSVTQKQMEMARLKKEIAKKIEKYAKRPKTKYVSSSTKVYELAPYIDYWVKNVERTGDLNYPEQAKRKDFRGNVMLTVGIWKSGEIESIRVVRSSGHRFLDEAAIHIVELAQPFDPLPENRDNLDILYITRTWQFLPGHLLRQK
ncbi:energy transducer TonB [Marinicella sp. W31]|uniref:energy transducer TonB n=1 Tax=Marinicella sp. W31 TaxID=3023713 RepID=UPI0037567065